MLEFNVLLIGAKFWEITDENTGELKNGVSVHYVNLDATIDENRGKGYESVKQSISINEKSKMQALKYPCLATMKATLSLSGKNSVVKPVSFDFVSLIDLKA